MSLPAHDQAEPGGSVNTNQTALYRIRNWGKHFETSETRKRRHALNWVLIKTTQGSGYDQVWEADRSGGVFGIFVALVEQAARCEERGTLANEDGPYTIEALARRIRSTPEHVGKALRILLQVGWIERLGGNLPESAGVCRNLPEFPVEEGVGEGVGEGEQLIAQPVKKSPPATPAKQPEVTIPDDLKDSADDIRQWLDYKRQRGQGYKSRALSALWTRIRAIHPSLRHEAFQHSMASNYAGLFAPHGATQAGTRVQAAPGAYDNISERMSEVPI